ncbi:MAG: DnaD domain protein [Ruminococcaceae bacterium]|nr:DnaD domain protein [Oscillospiraceae bacterium]
MKYTVNYGNGAGVFPKSVLDVISRAGAAELKVLICLCAEDGNADIERLSQLSGCDADDVRGAISFWRGAGIVEPCESNKKVKTVRSEKASLEAPKNETVKDQSPKKLRGADELPNYTSDQISDMLEKRTDMVTLIDECQNVLGKVLNVREINVIIGLIDYLELDFEYVVALLSYCVSIGKKTLHYAEKTAFGLYDAGICTSEQLMAELDRRERVSQMEGKIRTMFGIGTRALTTKEKKFISAWVSDFGYGIDIIQKAYEVTADATGSASIPYANSVLERWNAEGLRTPDAVDESYQKKTAEKKAHEGSFDTDEFFEAAVRYSLGDN